MMHLSAMSGLPSGSADLTVCAWAALAEVPVLKLLKPVRSWLVRSDGLDAQDEPE